VVLATSTLHLPDHAIHAAEPTLPEAARRLDPTGLGQVVTHTKYVLDPDAADARAQRRDERQGIWFTMTIDAMVVVHGTMTPRPATPSRRLWSRWPAPPTTTTPAAGGQRTADALTELARRQLEAGQLPVTGGVRPQLSVIVDLHSLDHPHPLDRRDRQDSQEGRNGLGGLGAWRVGWAGWAGRWAGRPPGTPSLPTPGL
jgi:Domain of unknown function (DUF222)